MGLWFSASAVVPQLSDDWHLSDAGRHVAHDVGAARVRRRGARLGHPQPPRPDVPGAPDRSRRAGRCRGERGGGAPRARAGPRDPAPVPDRRRARRRLPAGDQADGDVVSGGARPRRRRAGRSARARLRHAAPCERAPRPRLAGGAERGKRARRRRSRGRGRCGARGPVRRRGRPVSPRVRAAALRATAPSGWSASATSATCGSSMRCGRGCPPMPPRASPHRATAIRPGRRSSWRHSRRWGSRGWPAACWEASSPTRAAGPRSRSQRWLSAATCCVAAAAVYGVAPAIVVGLMLVWGMAVDCRLGPVLDRPHRSRRPGLRRDGRNGADGDRVRDHGSVDPAAADGARRRGVEVRVPVPRGRAGPRHRRDGAGTIAASWLTAGTPRRSAPRRRARAPSRARTSSASRPSQATETRSTTTRRPRAPRASARSSCRAGSRARS